MSTFSASAAMIFDLVIGFAIRVSSLLCVGFLVGTFQVLGQKGSAFYPRFPARCQQQSARRPLPGPSGLKWVELRPLWRRLAQHEHALAGARQAQLLAREALDGRGVAAQGDDLF